MAQSAEHDDFAMPRTDMTLVAGRALGREARARQLIAAVDGRFAALRKAHPEFAGRSTAVVEPYKPGQFAVFLPSDPKVVFMTSPGFTVPDAITKAVGTEYAAGIGSGRLDLVDVDRLVLRAAGKVAEGYAKVDRVYAGLEVARERRALFVPYGTPPIGAAISFNTVLSIPYALDRMIALAAGA